MDAFPICLDTKDTDEIVRIVKMMEPVFGGINLEDIAAPRCFEIETKLKEVMDIPIFHDDQHGTAVVTTAAIINALKLANKSIEDITAVINGSGAAGNSIAKLLLSLGIKDIFMCDRTGIISKNRVNLDKYKKELSEITNKENREGSLADAMRGALDVRAFDINEEMKLAAAFALAESVEGKLDIDFILPKAFDKGYTEKVAEAVRKAAKETGAARI